MSMLRKRRKLFPQTPKTQDECRHALSQHLLERVDTATRDGYGKRQDRDRSDRIRMSEWIVDCEIWQRENCFGFVHRGRKMFFLKVLLTNMILYFTVLLNVDIIRLSGDNLKNIFPYQTQTQGGGGSMIIPQ